MALFSLLFLPGNRRPGNWENNGIYLRNSDAVERVIKMKKIGNSALFGRIYEPLPAGLVPVDAESLNTDIRVNCNGPKKNKKTMRLRDIPDNHEGLYYIEGVERGENIISANDTGGNYGDSKFNKVNIDKDRYHFPLIMAPKNVPARPVLTVEDKGEINLII